jgi:hypothetical protein
MFILHPSFESICLLQTFTIIFLYIDKDQNKKNDHPNMSHDKVT